MTDYDAEMDRILAEYRGASRGVREQFLEADARTTRGGAELFADLREMLREEELNSVDEEQERAEQEERAERDRLMREEAARLRAEEAQRRAEARHGRDAVVMPSDWTEEDEARAEGYGPPTSWLQ